MAVSTGSLLMLLMWLATIPPEHNPIVDEHLIYVLVLGILKIYHAGNDFGLNKQWSNTNLVRKYPFLQ
jgi:thiosulfate dehydrogenase [quinone] large subunit